MSLWLDADELHTLTGKVRPSAQRRVLNHLHIPCQARPDGSLVVLRSDAEASQHVQPARREPRLRLTA